MSFNNLKRELQNCFFTLHIFPQKKKTKLNYVKKESLTTLFDTALSSQHCIKHIYWSNCYPNHKI